MSFCLLFLFLCSKINLYSCVLENKSKELVYIKKIRIFMIVFALVLTSVNVGCSSDKEKIVLEVWTAEDEIQIVRDAIEKFKLEHKEEADFEISVQVADVASSKKLLLTDKGNAADIFSFADDQFYDLYNEGCLLEVSENADKVISDCGEDSSTIEAIIKNDKLYGYPFTSGNGYFLLYNDEYFSKDDVKSLEKIIEIAEKNGKKISMDLNSGWYMYSFFGGAGMSIKMDEETGKNICDYNRTSGGIIGKQVVNSVIKIASSDGFVSLVNENVEENVRNGNVIALVAGTWFVSMLKDVWGEHLNAAKLPTYMAGDKELQMSSFAGCRYYGINANTKETEWAMKLCEYLTSSEQQLERFRQLGDCPANVEVAQLDEIQKSVAVKALLDQKKYAIIQNVAESYWKPMEVLGAYVASGNTDKKDIQQLLDEVVLMIQK